MNRGHYHDHLVAPILSIVLLAGAAICLVYLIQHMRKRRVALSASRGPDAETLRKARLAGERARQWKPYEWRAQPPRPRSDLDIERMTGT